MNFNNLGKIVLLLMFVLLGSLSANSQPRIETVEVEELKKALDDRQEIVVLDVRRPAETLRGKIPGAENIDIQQDEFWLKFKDLNREKKYYVYCNTGGKSTSAARVMKQLGFKYVYDLRGGIEAWKSEGYLIE